MQNPSTSLWRALQAIPLLTLLLIGMQVQAQVPFANQPWRWAKRSASAAGEKIIALRQDSAQNTYALIQFNNSVSWEGVIISGGFTGSPSYGLYKIDASGAVVWGRYLSSSFNTTTPGIYVHETGRVVYTCAGFSANFGLVGTSRALIKNRPTVAFAVIGADNSLIYSNTLAASKNISLPLSGKAAVCYNATNGFEYDIATTAVANGKDTIYLQNNTIVPLAAGNTIPFVLHVGYNYALPSYTASYYSGSGKASATAEALVRRPRNAGFYAEVYLVGNFVDSLYLDVRAANNGAKVVVPGRSQVQAVYAAELRGATGALNVNRFAYTANLNNAYDGGPSLIHALDAAPRRDTGVVILNERTYEYADPNSPPDFTIIGTYTSDEIDQLLPTVANSPIRQQHFVSNTGSIATYMAYTGLDVYPNNNILVQGFYTANYETQAGDGPFSPGPCVTEMNPAATTYYGTLGIPDMGDAVPVESRGPAGFIAAGGFTGTKTLTPFTLSNAGSQQAAWAGRYSSIYSYLTAASPSAAMVGQTIILYGEHLSGASTVSFGGTLVNASASTNNTVTITVPAGLSTGLVSVSVATPFVTNTVRVQISSSAWPITFGGGNDDFVRGIVRDASGNVFASLSFRGTIALGNVALTSTSATRRDMALAKFNDAGALLWVKRVGNGSFDMEPQGVNIDGSGNVYWAGSFAGTVSFPAPVSPKTLTAAGSYDAFVARFDPATGDCSWARKVGGAGNDYLYGCFVSNSGNVYAGGSYTGAISFQTGATSVNLSNAGGLDGFIVKFDNAGTGIYASRMGSTADDEVKSIEYNGGDLVACGYMGNNCQFPGAAGAITLPSISASRDGWAARINSTGQYVWVKNFGTIFNDEGASICLDPSTGNVFCAAQVADAPFTFNGTSFNGKGKNDIAVLGWNFYTQAAVWAQRVGTAGGDVPAVIRWDGQGLALAGTIAGPVTLPAGIPGLSFGGALDAVLLRFNKATGAVTSGQNWDYAFNEQAFALWCNTATRECFVGGGFATWTQHFPPGVERRASRTSTYDSNDGFLMRVPATSVAREGEENVAATEGRNIKAWPVPFADKLTVETTQPIELLNLQGRQLLHAHPVAGQAAFTTASLPRGLYILRTSDGRVVRVVKE